MLRSLTPLSPIRRGVFPGSFNPPTIAHVSIAIAARSHFELDVITLVLSTQALGKSSIERPTLDERLEILETSLAGHDGIDAAVTDLQLIADIAAGFDVVVMGADKWRQVNDPIFYNGDAAARDAAVASLPTVAVVPRPPDPVPRHLAFPLPTKTMASLIDVSSSRARSGHHADMTPAAAEFARRTGLWPPG